MQIRDRIEQVAVELRSVDAEGRQIVMGALDELTAHPDMAEDDYEQSCKVARQGIGCLRILDRELHQSEYAYAFTIDEMETRLKEIDAYRRHGKKYNASRVKLIRPTPTNAHIDMLEKRNRHFAQGMTIWKLMLLLFIGSLFGVIMEEIWCVIVHGRIESRAGLLYGPFNLLYGVGAVILSALLYNVRNLSKLYSFLGGFVGGSVVEFSCSWLQEKFFGATSWDYSHLPFNIQGRVCLLYSIFWGLLGVLWIKDIYPRVSAMILKIPNSVGKPLTVALVVFLALDGLITSVAALRWKTRVEGLPPQTAIARFCDVHYTDERMEKTFAGWSFVSDGEEPDQDNFWIKLFTD